MISILHRSSMNNDVGGKCLKDRIPRLNEDVGRNSPQNANMGYCNSIWGNKSIK